MKGLAMPNEIQYSLLNENSNSSQHLKSNGTNRRLLQLPSILRASCIITSLLLLLYIMSLYEFHHYIIPQQTGPEVSIDSNKINTMDNNFNKDAFDLSDSSELDSDEKEKNQKKKNQKKNKVEKKNKDEESILDESDSDEEDPKNDPKQNDQNVDVLNKSDLNEGDLDGSNSNETLPNLQKTPQEQETRCDPIDYDKVVEMNSHPLPKKTISYEGENAICEGKNEGNCLPKLLHVNHGQYYWVSKKAKILACSIKKNMSQLLQSILCFLNDELKFLYGGKDLVRDVFNRGCMENMFRDLKKPAFKKLNVNKENGWSYVSIVRDPADRFLSGFIYMCIAGEIYKNQACRYDCHGCGKNMTCYAEKQYEKIKKMTKNPDKHAFDPPTEHSYPQSWRCGFDKSLQNYTFLHYKIDSQEFYPTIKDYLTSRNVSERALGYIHNKMTSIRTLHSTALSSVRPFLEKRLRSSSYLMDIILKTYYHDFKIFNFDLPKIPET